MVSVALALLLGGAPVSPDAVQPGHRVRWAEGSRLRTGAVVDLARGTLAVSTRDGVRLLRLPDLSRLEIRQGGPRKLWQGALVGVAVGLGVFAAFREDDATDVPREAGAWAAGGAAVGMTTGALVWAPRWRAVDIDALRPAPAPAQVSLRLGF